MYTTPCQSFCRLETNDMSHETLYKEDIDNLIQKIDQKITSCQNDLEVLIKQKARLLKQRELFEDAIIIYRLNHEYIQRIQKF